MFINFLVIIISLILIGIFSNLTGKLSRIY